MWMNNEDKENINISMTKTIGRWDSGYDSASMDIGPNILETMEVQDALEILRKAGLLSKVEMLPKIHQLLTGPNGSSNLSLIFQLCGMNPNQNTNSTKDCSDGMEKYVSE